MSLKSSSELNYEIRVKGHFAQRWLGQFEPFQTAYILGEVTVLRGRVPDQSGLHAFLRNLEATGVTLVGLSEIEGAANQAPPVSPTGDERWAR